jgi:transcriptional regulator with XRE-family HTH domain
MAGYRIRELRETAGLSRAALADRLGVKEATIGLIEDGYFEPRAVHILALADILGVKPEELLAKGGVPAKR